jgi:hypothetical protein
MIDAVVIVCIVLIALISLPVLSYLVVKFGTVGT